MTISSAASPASRRSRSPSAPVETSSARRAGGHGHPQDAEPLGAVEQREPHHRPVRAVAGGTGQDPHVLVGAARQRRVDRERHGPVGVLVLPSPRRSRRAGPGCSAGGRRGRPAHRWRRRRRRTGGSAPADRARASGARPRASRRRPPRGGSRRAAGPVAAGWARRSPTPPRALRRRARPAARGSVATRRPGASRRPRRWPPRGCVPSHPRTLSPSAGPTARCSALRSCRSDRSDQGTYMHRSALRLLRRRPRSPRDRLVRHHHGRGHVHRLQAVARGSPPPPHGAVVGAATGWPGRGAGSSWRPTSTDAPRARPAPPAARCTGPPSASTACSAAAPRRRAVGRAGPPVARGRRRLGRGHPAGAPARRPRGGGGDAGRPRTTGPHGAAYDAASALLAPWPATTPPSPASTAGATSCCTPVRSRASTAARVLDRPTSPPARTDPCRVLLLGGYGGGTVRTRTCSTAAGRDARLALGGARRRARRRSTTSGPTCSRPTSSSCTAGRTPSSEVAAARRPAVVVAQPRPHEEQLHRVAHPAPRPGCASASTPGRPRRWPDLLARAAGGRWRGVDAGGARATPPTGRRRGRALARSEGRGGDAVSG